MNNSFNIDDLKRWVENMNRTRGYGAVFNYKTKEDKAIVELSTAREWCASVRAEFGLSVGEPEHNPHDPPDCYVSIEQQRVGIELEPIHFMLARIRRQRSNLRILVV